ncbi:MAG: ABC transporter substrate-binding protein, partial [Spirochaeta sp.]
MGISIRAGFRAVLLVAALAVLFAFAGCGPEVAETDDTLTISIGAEPESLDPVNMTSAPAATVAEHVVERLIYMEEDGSLSPMLAESWISNEDGTVWTFNIQPDATFHDGEPLNAEAVAINLRRFVDPEVGAAYSFLLGSVQDIRALDEYTLQLTLAEPFAPILSHLSHSFIGIVSPAQLEGLGPDETFEVPIGTGPYVMESWNRGESIQLSRNENYYRTVPSIENVEFTFVPEASARIVALETGEADAIMAVPPQDTDRLAADPDIDVVYQTSV